MQQIEAQITGACEAIVNKALATSACCDYSCIGNTLWTSQRFEVRTNITQCIRTGTTVRGPPVSIIAACGTLVSCVSLRDGIRGEAIAQSCRTVVAHNIRSESSHILIYCQPPYKSSETTCVPIRHTDCLICFWKQIYKTFRLNVISYLMADVIDIARG